MRNVCSFLLVSLVVIAPTIAFALGETEAMRCSNGIASPGDTIQVLLEKCGQPARRGSAGRTYRFAGKDIYGSEVWIYDFGPNEFVYEAVLSRGRVVILYSTRDYGTNRR